MLLMLTMSTGIMAQSAVVIGLMSPDSQTLPAAAHQLLENKMVQALTKSGFGGETEACRFVMSCSVVEVNKEITPSNPPMTALKLALTYSVLDVDKGVILASATVNVKGAGENDTKAYLAAIKNVRPSDSSVKKMLDKSRLIIEALLEAEKAEEAAAEQASEDNNVAEPQVENSVE